MTDMILDRYNYWIYIILMMMGIYAMVANRHLVRKLIGLSIFQTAIILFYISISSRDGGTVPVLLGGHGHAPPPDVVYLNPLPHVLMLTAIVVAVSSTGVALAILLRVHRRYGTLEEDRILAALNRSAQAAPKSRCKQAEDARP